MVNLAAYQNEMMACDFIAHTFGDNPKRNWNLDAAEDQTTRMVGLSEWRNSEDYTSLCECEYCGEIFVPEDTEDFDVCGFYSEEYCSMRCAEIDEDFLKAQESADLQFEEMVYGSQDNLNETPTWEQEPEY